MKNIVGNNIKQRRIELNLTQPELAKLMGYKSKAAISRVENGKEDLTLTRVIKFANALNCSPAYLAGWGENKDPSTTESLLYDAYEVAPINIKRSVCSALNVEYIDIEKKSSNLA